MKEMSATERADLDTAYRGAEEMQRWLPKHLVRLNPWLPLQQGDRILDVGAAQGITVCAFTRAGFDAVGIEPYGPALEVGRELASRIGVSIRLHEAYAEELPFEDQSFRYVHAVSVLEHVDDPVQVIREAYRVLLPGGGFYFRTSGVLNPRQNEIALFPLFPWYPETLQRRIMFWARDHRPELVGHTSRPAIHWFRQRAVLQWLRDTGFRRVVGRWTIHARSGEHSGLEKALVTAASRSRVVRFGGNLFRGNVEYLALK